MPLFFKKYPSNVLALMYITLAFCTKHLFLNLTQYFRRVLAVADLSFLLFYFLHKPKRMKLLYITSTLVSEKFRF